MQLISPNSVLWAEEILSNFRAKLGKLASTVHANGVTGRYIEALHVNSCMSGAVRFHRPHHHDVVVEASYFGDELDACLLLFLRRILEEGGLAEQTSDLFGVKIVVRKRETETLSTQQSLKSVFSFFPSEIKSAKKQVILTAMKAAVVDGGIISMQCYALSAHSIQPLQGEQRGQAKQTKGFVKMTRRYFFTFHNHTLNTTRCFYRNPYESLATCLFQCMEDANHVRQNFNAHCLTGHAGSSDSKTDSVFEFIRNQVAAVLSHLDAGELCLASESLMVLLVHSCVDHHHLPFSVRRLSSITSKTPGFLRAIRDAVNNFSDIVSMSLSSIKEISALQVRSDRTLWSDDFSKRAIKLENQVVNISAGLEELRELLCAMERDVVSSEKSRVFSHAMTQYRIIIEATKQRNRALKCMVVLSKGAWDESHFVGLPSMTTQNVTWLHGLSISLQKIMTVLIMFETTVASDVLLELFQLETDQVHILSPQWEAPRDAGALIDSVTTNAELDTSVLFGSCRGGNFSSDLEVDTNYEFESRLPLLLTDVFGVLGGMHECKDLRLMTKWSPLNTYSYSWRQLLLHRAKEGMIDGRMPNIGASSSTTQYRPDGDPLDETSEAFVMDTEAEEVALSMRKDYIHEAYTREKNNKRSFFSTSDVRHCPTITPGRFASNFLHVYPSLGLGWSGRLGSVDAVAALFQEFLEYESPRGIATEATRSRYLVETHVYR